jgi:hypothetical protein
VLASVNVVKLGLGDTVVDVDAGTEEFFLRVKLVKSGDTGGGFFGDSFQVFGEFAEEVFVLLEAVVDGFEEVVLVFGLSASVGFDEVAGFFEFSFLFQTVNAQESGVSSVVDDEFGAFAVFP